MSIVGTRMNKVFRAGPPGQDQRGRTSWVGTTGQPAGLGKDREGPQGMTGAGLLAGLQQVAKRKVDRRSQVI